MQLGFSWPQSARSFSLVAREGLFPWPPLLECFFSLTSLSLLETLLPRFIQARWLPSPSLGSSRADRALHFLLQAGCGILRQLLLGKLCLLPKPSACSVRGLVPRSVSGVVISSVFDCLWCIWGASSGFFLSQICCLLEWWAFLPQWEHRSGIESWRFCFFLLCFCGSSLGFLRLFRV
jgi:hypothetical protein